MNYQPLSLIDGQWVGAAGGATFAVRNPATGATLADVADCGSAEADKAIAAAQAAFPAWARRTAKERAVLLRRWFDAINANADALARLITDEMGKPIAESRGEVAYGASFVEWFAEEARRVYGETIPGHQADKRIIVIRQPVGVVAAITPWNFPLAMITRKVAPALAAGCTVVAKPSEDAPLTALALGQLALEAGIPPGVLNVVVGRDAAAIGRALTADHRVRKLTFTGSTEVGKLLYEQCASTVKKISLELGGNAPFIVFDSADLEQAVEGAMLSKFRNAGQTCVCANRIYAQAGIHDAFVKRLTERVDSLAVGPGEDEATQIGPLINAQGLEKVQAHLADALERGASLATGGGPHPAGGLFFTPTVVTGVTADMQMSREETFGPVAPVFRFDHEDEVIGMANDTPFGLAAYFYTRDLAQAFRVYESLEYGIVGVNTGIISTEVAPFGGVKESGLGREGGPHGIEEFVEVKYGCFGI